MKYDFESILDRLGMDAIAPEPKTMSFLSGKPVVEQREGFDIIPMWVADMNFPVVPSITKALVERATHPSFGYFFPRKEYYRSIIKWHEQRNGVTGLESKHIGYENSVIGGLTNALRVLCSRGENILVHRPTYVGFTMALNNNGYNTIHTDLKLDKDNVWRMDFEDMEQKIIKHKIHTTIFCSPHNPCGRVWEQWELERAMEIFEKHSVRVVSDEIWSDLLMPGQKHIPVQSVSPYAKASTIALYAPSKTFNLAGLVGSYHIIYDDYLRDRVLKESSLSHYNVMNVLSMHASIGGYSEQGAEWLSELMQVIEGNIDYAIECINGIDGVTTVKPEATYMLFLDCEQYLKKNDMTLDQLVNLGHEHGVIWQSGEMFSTPYSVRMNFALPKSRVIEAMERLKKYVFVK